MMKRVTIYLLLFISTQAQGQQLFQLAPPMLKYKSAFFKDSTSFSILFDQPGAEIRYTLNSKEPTENDLLYSGSVAITKRTVVKVKAFGQGFLPSETVELIFVEDGKAIAGIQYSKPDEQYVTSKIDILHDNIGGSLSYHDGTWLGYNSDTVEINIHLPKREKVNAMLIDLLQDEGSWIFLPEQIELYYYQGKKKAFVPVEKELFFFGQQQPRRAVSKIIPVKGKIKTNKLKLLLLPLKHIPDWHSGKGNHAWLFIDEIKVY